MTSPRFFFHPADLVCGQACHLITRFSSARHVLPHMPLLCCRPVTCPPSFWVRWSATPSSPRTPECNNGCAACERTATHTLTRHTHCWHAWLQGCTLPPLPPPLLHLPILPHQPPIVQVPAVTRRRMCWLGMARSGRFTDICSVWRPALMRGCK